MNTGRVLLVSLLLLTACEEQPLLAVGQLESDRVELIAEYAETIVAIEVTEGDMLQPGALVLRQNAEKIENQIVEITAHIERLQALLQEQLNGPTPERIAVVEAALREVEVERNFRQRDLQRLQSLRAQNLTSVESVDNAQRLFESAVARIASVEAQLGELHAGTREEQREQTRRQIEQVLAQRDALRINLARLQITAPVTGLVDSLPFEVGERPRQGDVVAVLLTGSQPYARIYLPESIRASVQPGSELNVAVDGIGNVLRGTVRRIASEPAFTPYFALTERDRGRLSYMTEVELPVTDQRLPEGLPVQVVFE